MLRYPLRFSFTPQKNERIEAVVTLPQQQCSIVHGTVYDTQGCLVKNAVVRLFLCSGEKDEPVADTITDNGGEFVFGPLEEQKNYVIKVYTSGALLREITVKPRKKRTKAIKDS